MFLQNDGRPEHVVHDVRIADHSYSLHWKRNPVPCPSRGDVVITQVNSTTKKVRHLSRRQGCDMWASVDPAAHVLRVGDIEKLIDLVAHQDKTRVVAWLSTFAPSQDEFKQVAHLFLHSNSPAAGAAVGVAGSVAGGGGGGLGQSMSEWAATTRSTVQVTAVAFVHNPGLAESFLMQRHNLKHGNNMCLFGFHGTHTTHPHTIALNGLDPRFSNATVDSKTGAISTNLYLGVAAYVSLSARLLSSQPL